ncbi:MAG: SMC-Scp complex subunit ScpB [Spirochaetales bacterium]|nr:SMC-Scp complex subunit ScpB [Candidatus Physcosoma equi]
MKKISIWMRMMMSEIRQLSEDAKIVEVVLFIENTPLSRERISQLTGLHEEDIVDALRELKDQYSERNSGMFLLEEEELFSFQPVPELYPQLRQSYGRKVDRRLSRAALETLSIVAYSQPITRAEIDKIRGIQSDSIVRLLRERDYIKVNGRADRPGHPCLYCTTRKFLYEFKLKSISELPKLSEADRLKFTKENEGELF